MDELDRILAQSARDLRVAIIGIGNVLNGDDAAGVLAARKLIDVLRRKRGAPPAVEAELEERGRVLVIAAGPAPESFSGPLRRFQPGLVVMIDAAEMGEPPGTLRVFNWTEAQGMSASTHSMPPSMLARFLVNTLGCQVLMAGIQPAGLDFDQPVSPEVTQAVHAISDRLLSLLGD